ncbi:hypothetical protein N7100_000883 [Neisseria gonorrhoeae]
MPIIQTILEGGDIKVKNLKTENYSGKVREILGDSYPEHISKNISTIQNIISEFIRQKQTPAPNNLMETQQSRCRLKQLGLSDGISFA